jgi:hypothetical protein
MTSRRISTPVLALLAVAFAAAWAGCSQSTGDLGGVATPLPTAGASQDIPTSEPSGSPVVPSSAEPTPATTDPVTTTVRAYFFLGSFTGNAGLAPVARTIPKTQAVGAAAMRALLNGPNDSELGASPAFYTTIPDGTRFLGLDVSNGVATVNLSREFEAGGDAISVLGRLAQVVYTLTQFPSVDHVAFEVEGSPLTAFSGDGVVLDHPVGRADYEGQLAPIFVDRPVWGATIDNPVRIAGTADVFEAQFLFVLADAKGRILAQGPIHASCGTGCRGTYDITVPYTVQGSLSGTLKVYDRSEKDGSVIDAIEYPVTLTPAG